MLPATLLVPSHVAFEILSFLLLSPALTTKASFFPGSFDLAEITLAILGVMISTIFHRSDCERQSKFARLVLSNKVKVL